jgi:asparagine synthase (glutamine-hydrolysing)
VLDRPLRTLLPTDDEVCVSILFGQDPATRPLDLRHASPGARPVIERLLLGALRRGPVWVAFSGGRDSSALLAIAASVARREGLPLPVPATLVFPGVAATEEEDWQRLVLEHLGLEDAWVRVTPGTDLDLLGPYARRVLDHSGVVLPSNAHALLPILDQLGDTGTLVTGGGGDDLMEGRPQRLSSAVLSRVRLTRDELPSAVTNDLPGRLLNRGVARRSLMAGLHWITPALRRRLLQLEITDRKAFPVRFDRLLQRAWQDRYFQMAGEAYAWVPMPDEVRVLQPFHEHDVVAEIGRAHV